MSDSGHEEMQHASQQNSVKQTSGQKSNSTAQGSLKTREIHNPSVFDRYLPHFLLLQIRHNKSRQNQGFSWVPTVWASPYLPTVVCHHRPMT